MGPQARLAPPLLTLLVFAATFSDSEAFADPPRRSGNSYGQPNANATGGYSTQTTPGHSTSSRAETRTPSKSRTPSSHAGSANKTHPGFQQNSPSTQQGHHEGAPHVVYVPTTPYYPAPYYTAPYSVAPPSIHMVQNMPTAPALPPRAEPAPQRVYVVNPPAATRPPQPVYIVNPDSTGATATGETATKPPRTPAPAPPAQPAGPVEIEYRITPGDAKVYLDDLLLGTGEDLVTAQDPLQLKPGVHVLEVTHPDHRSQRVVFGASSSEPLTVVVDLTTERTGQRSRVR